jgi:hypothetical protein
VPGIEPGLRTRKRSELVVHREDAGLGIEWGDSEVLFAGSGPRPLEVAVGPRYEEWPVSTAGGRELVVAENWVGELREGGEVAGAPTIDRQSEPAASRDAAQGAVDWKTVRSSRRRRSSSAAPRVKLPPP